MSGTGKPAFIGWVREQLDARDEKPLDELWRVLNAKELPPMTDREGLRFRNLIRECQGQEPFKDSEDPTQNHGSEKKKQYQREWHARKKAERQAQLQ